MEVPLIWAAKGFYKASLIENDAVLALVGKTKHGHAKYIFICQLKKKNGEICNQEMDRLPRIQVHIKTNKHLKLEDENTILSDLKPISTGT